MPAVPVGEHLKVERGSGLVVDEGIAAQLVKLAITGVHPQLGGPEIPAAVVHCAYVGQQQHRSVRHPHPAEDHREVRLGEALEQQLGEEFVEPAIDDDIEPGIEQRPHDGLGVRGEPRRLQ